MGKFCLLNIRSSLWSFLSYKFWGEMADIILFKAKMNPEDYYLPRCRDVYFDRYSQVFWRKLLILFCYLKMEDSSHPKRLYQSTKPESNIKSFILTNIVFANLRNKSSEQHFVNGSFLCFIFVSLGKTNAASGCRQRYLRSFRASSTWRGNAIAKANIPVIFIIIIW